MKTELEIHVWMRGIYVKVLNPSYMEDSSVGISKHLDNFKLTTFTGLPLDWELTDAEYEQVSNAVFEAEAKYEEQQLAKMPACKHGNKGGCDKCEAELWTDYDHSNNNL